MSSNIYIHKYCNSPEYEVKILLIALRKLYEISENEMAELLEVSKKTLMVYEKDTMVSPYFTAKYIEILDEYVSYAEKRKMMFEEAIRIYKRQKCLYKYPIAYKLTLFGNIFYDSAYAEMKDYESEKEKNKKEKEKDTQSIEIVEDVEGELIEFSEEKKEAWNMPKYKIAFHLLKTLRNVLQVSLEELSEMINISETVIRMLEKSVESYKGDFSLRTIVREYSEYLQECMANNGVKCYVYETISSVLRVACNEKDEIAITQDFFKKLYEN